MVFFNGDRITFAKTYVRKRDKKRIQDKTQLEIGFPTGMSSAFEAFENEVKP